MGMQCAVCAKKPSIGNQYVRSGKAKYLGGVAARCEASASGRLGPNLQRMQCQVGGSVQTLRVCVQCLRSGKVQRPQKRKPFTMMSV